MSLIKISEILGLFVNKLTVDDKYSLLDSENLEPPIEIQLWKKHKLFANCMKSTSNFEHS